jgi:hypothetical protein
MPSAVKTLTLRFMLRHGLLAEIILLRLDGVGVEAVAERLKTIPKRVSLWSGRFETLGLN